MSLSELNDVYRDALLEHSRRPRNRDELEKPDITASAVNPFCGDEIHLQISLDGGQRVKRIGLQGVGCAINRAAGSMLTDALSGKTLSEVDRVHTAFSLMMQGEDQAAGGPELPGELHSLSGVRRLPVRIKCALLAWSALEDGLREYRRERPS